MEHGEKWKSVYWLIRQPKRLVTEADAQLVVGEEVDQHGV